MTRRGSLICFPGLVLGAMAAEPPKADCEFAVMIEDRTPGLTLEQAERQFQEMLPLLWGLDNSIEIRRGGKVIKRAIGK